MADASNGGSLLASALCFGLSSTFLVFIGRLDGRRRSKPIVDVEQDGRTKRLLHYLSDHDDWNSYDASQERFVQEFPKIELHVHLDGAFDPEFLFKYMTANPDVVQCLPVETVLPWDSSNTLPVRELVEKCQNPRDYHDLCTCRGHRSLKAMLNCFEFFLPLVRRNLELLEQLALDFCQRQFEQNTVYTEVRYSPFLLAASYNEEEEDNSGGGGGGDDNGEDSEEIDPELVFAAVTRGLRRGCVKFNITVNQILCAITWRPDWAEPTLEMAKKHQNDYPCAVVGIDIAAGEEHYDKDEFPELYQPHFDMIQQAKKCGIPITLHAGESTEGAMENVRRAVFEYGARRIGHGYRMSQNKELMMELRERNIHVEVCPTSSLETGGWEFYGEKNWEKHPCVKMKECGVSLSLSSDDPAVFHTSLAWQYRIALAKMKFSREDLVQANLNGIDGAFCSEHEKERLRLLVQAYAAATKVKLNVSDERNLEMKLEQRDWKRSMSESFVDRVYISKQYF